MSGRKWTRFTLVLMLLISMAANVGHTLLAESAIPTWLRMTGAVIWPLIVFLAIEVLVRNDWTRGFTHGAIRTTILAPAIPAAITSYEHMHAVLLSMGERPFIAAIGPGAVDLLMIGCTLALLLTAPKSVSVDALLERWDVSEAPVSPAPIGEGEQALAEMLERVDQTMIAPSPQNAERLEQVERVTNRLPATGEVQEITRSPRQVWDAARVVELALEGVPAPAAVAETGIGASSYRRFLRVAKILQADPRATIDRSEKVPDAYVGMMRNKVLAR